MTCLARGVLSKEVPCAMTQRARITNIPCVLFPACSLSFEIVIENNKFRMKINDTDASPPSLPARLSHVRADQS